MPCCLVGTAGYIGIKIGECSVRTQHPRASRSEPSRHAPAAAPITVHITSNRLGLAIADSVAATSSAFASSIAVASLRFVIFILDMLVLSNIRSNKTIS